MRKNTIHNILKTTSVRKAWAVVFVVAGTMLTATSCADDDAPSAPLQTVQLLVSVPAQTLSASQHRLGDPGTAVPEGGRLGLPDRYHGLHRRQSGREEGADHHPIERGF